MKDPPCSCIQVEKMSLGRLVSCLAVTCEDEGLYLYKTAYSAHYSAEQQIFVDLRNWKMLVWVCTCAWASVSNSTKFLVSHGQVPCLRKARRIFAAHWVFLWHNRSANVTTAMASQLAANLYHLNHDVCATDVSYTLKSKQSNVVVPLLCIYMHSFVFHTTAWQ